MRCHVRTIFASQGLRSALLIFFLKMSRADRNPWLAKMCKNNSLEKSNYRPVIVLLIFFKNLGKVMEIQLWDYFNSIFHPYLCVFRKGHGCQTTLLGLIEDWRTALDKNQYIAAVLMDLSKAFDCLPHEILLDKLSAYGVLPHSVSLLKSYLTNRKQQIKINNVLSNWADIHKGVPHYLMCSSMILFLLLSMDLFIIMLMI